MVASASELNHSSITDDKLDFTFACLFIVKRDEVTLTECLDGLKSENAGLQDSSEK